MADPTLYATNQSFLGIGKEGTRGTAASTFLWLPTKSPSTTFTQAYLNDEGYRGSPVQVYDVVLGVNSGQFDHKGDVHLDTFPQVIEALLGGTDTVSGTAAPYTHTQPLLNSATTGSQPPSYTVQDFNGYKCQQMTGAQLSSLQLDFATTSSLEYTAKWIGLAPTIIATPNTQTFGTTDKLIPAWNCAVSVGGSSNATLVTGSITIDRSTEAVAALSTQGPASVFTGPIKVSGKFTFLTVTSDPIYSTAFSYTPEAVTFTFTDPSSTHTFLIQMSAAQMESAVYDRAKNYVQVSTNFEASSNSTDASTGYSPIKFVTTNAQSAAY